MGLGMVSTSARLRLGFATSIDAQQLVRRTEVKQARRQRQHADPTPDTDAAAQCQTDQDSADRDTRQLVDTANITFHIAFSLNQKVNTGTFGSRIISAIGPGAATPTPWRRSLSSYALLGRKIAQTSTVAPSPIIICKRPSGLIPRGPNSVSLLYSSTPSSPAASHSRICGVVPCSRMALARIIAMPWVCKESLETIKSALSA